MRQKTYTFDAAAGLLNMGRNTLIRRLRELKLIGDDNLPAGRERGGKHFRVVPSVFNHPVQGWTPYGRTELTREGLLYVAKQLGVEVVIPKDEQQQARSRINPAARHPNGAPKRRTATPMSIIPNGTLHDAGELTVINQDGERVTHRAAMVLVFDSPRDLQLAIDAHSCAYHARPDIPEERLHPELLAGRA